MARHMTRRQRRWFKAPHITGKELREQRWRKQCFGVLRFLGELRNSPELGGDKWKEGMRTHYSAKAADLIAQAPKGLEDEAADFARKLKKV